MEFFDNSDIYISPTEEEFTLNKITEFIKQNINEQQDNYLKYFYDNYFINDSVNSQLNKANYKEEQKYPYFIDGIRYKVITESIILNIIKMNKFHKDKIENNDDLDEFYRRLIFNISLTRLSKGFDLKTTNYSDEIIYNFIDFCLIKYDIEKIDNETSFECLTRICSIYNVSEPLIKKLKNKIIQKFYTNIIQSHSFIIKNEISKNINIKEFFNFLENLYFDRDDGYRIPPLDLNNISETTNLNLYEYFQNTPKQVNLICFIEEQRQPSAELRTDLKLFYKFIDISKIFDAIGFKVIVMCSKFGINKNNQTCIINKPYKFNEIHNFDLLLNRYTINCINFYLDVDFECL